MVTKLTKAEIAAIDAATLPEITLIEAPVVVAAAIVAPQETLLSQIAAVLDADRAKMIEAVSMNFETRAAFEKTANPANDTIQDKLKAYHKKMALPGIAGLMIATQVSPSFINRSIAEGKRFNIYAIDKLNDLLHGLNSTHFHNAINLAVMRSMFKFRAAGMTFTGLAAQAAASDKVKVDKAMNVHLVRHTVAAGTAPTQSSSTMNALQVLGVVTNSGSVKFPIWNLTDAPVTKRLEELLAA